MKNFKEMAWFFIRIIVILSCFAEFVMLSFIFLYYWTLALQLLDQFVVYPCLQRWSRDNISFQFTGIARYHSFKCGSRWNVLYLRWIWSNQKYGQTIRGTLFVNMSNVYSINVDSRKTNELSNIMLFVTAVVCSNWNQRRTLFERNVSSGLNRWIFLCVYIELMYFVMARATEYIQLLKRT